MTLVKISNLVLILGIVSLAAAASVKKDDGTPKPPVKFFIFREDCFDIFFTKNDFANVDCLKFTLSKLIGYLIITGAFILKVPQILKILKNKSVHGISKIMFYIETLMFIHSSSFSIHNKIPFSVYGENLIILAQNLIIVLLFWTFNKSIGIAEKFLLFVFITAYSFLLF